MVFGKMVGSYPKLTLIELRKDLSRYMTFLFGGGVSLLLNLMVTYGLTEYLHFWHMFSFAVALTLELFFLFIYHSLVTFKKKGHFFLFVMVILFISTLNWVSVYMLSELWNIRYVFSIIIAAGVISLLNYLINRNVVFKDEKMNSRTERFIKN